MKNDPEIEKAFLADLKALLKKYDAELKLEEKFQGYEFDEAYVEVSFENGSSVVLPIFMNGKD